MKKIKNFVDKLNDFIEKNAQKESISLEQAITVLEELRVIKYDLEDISQELNGLIIETFKALKIKELNYQHKIIKLRYVTNYYFDKLVQALDQETKEKLSQYLEPKLNRKIINRAISDKVLPVNSFDELLESGLIEKQTKYFLKFKESNKSNSSMPGQSLETMR